MAIETEKMGKIKDRFVKATSHRQSRKDYKWKQLDAFDRGDHHAFSTTPLWMPKPVTNYVNYVHKYHVASVSVENLTGTIRPLDMADDANITSLEAVYRNIWEYTGTKFVIRKALERCRLLGTGIVYVGYDPDPIRGGKTTNNQGALVVKAIDPANVYPDPLAFTIEDCRYIFISERKTVGWVLSQGAFRNENGTPKFSVSELRESSMDMDEKGEIYNARDYENNQVEDDDLVNFYTYYYQEVSEKGEVRFGVKYFANWVELADIDLPYKRFPLVFMYDQEQTDDIWGISDCEQILENQKILNIMNSVVALYACLMQTPQKLVNVSSGINVAQVAKYGSAPAMVWGTSMDVDKSMRNLDPPEVGNTVMRFIDMIKEDIILIAGLNGAYTGGKVGSITTSGGVNTLVDRATVLDRDFNIGLEKFIKELSILIIETFRAFVDTDSPYFFRMDELDPNVNAEYGVIRLEPEEVQALTEVDYDIIIDTHARTVDEVKKIKEEALNLMQMQMQFQYNPPLITPAEFISMQDFPNKTNILKRYQTENEEVKLQKMSEFIMQVMQIMSDPQMAQNPEVQSMTLQQLAEAGVQMMNPNAQQEQKLGSVQQKQGGTPTQAGVAQPLK